jgi:hypothetical protein
MSAKIYFQIRSHSGVLVDVNFKGRRALSNPLWGLLGVVRRHTMACFAEVMRN